MFPSWKHVHKNCLGQPCPLSSPCYRNRHQTSCGQPGRATPSLPALPWMGQASRSRRLGDGLLAKEKTTNLSRFVAFSFREGGWERADLALTVEVSCLCFSLLFKVSLANENQSSLCLSLLHEQILPVAPHLLESHRLACWPRGASYRNAAFLWAP